MVELRKHGATAARFTSSNLPTEYQIVEALRQNEGATVIERDVKTMREVPCQGYTEWLDFEAARQASSNPEPVAKPALAPTQSPASPPSVVTDDADSEGPWPPFEEKKSEPKAKPNPKRAPKVEAAPAQPVPAAIPNLDEDEAASEGDDVDDGEAETETTIPAEKRPCFRVFEKSTYVLEHDWLPPGVYHFTTSK
jgi:hypothetical protein